MVWEIRYLKSLCPVMRHHAVWSKCTTFQRNVLPPSSVTSFFYSDDSNSRFFWKISWDQTQYQTQHTYIHNIQQLPSQNNQWSQWNSHSPVTSTMRKLEKSGFISLTPNFLLKQTDPSQWMYSTPLLPQWELCIRPHCPSTSLTLKMVITKLARILEQPQHTLHSICIKLGMIMTYLMLSWDNLTRLDSAHSPSCDRWGRKLKIAKCVYIVATNIQYLHQTHRKSIPYTVKCSCSLTCFVKWLHVPVVKIPLI